MNILFSVSNLIKPSYSLSNKNKKLYFQQNRDIVSFKGNNIRNRLEGINKYSSSEINEIEDMYTHNPKLIEEITRNTESSEGYYDFYSIQSIYKESKKEPEVVQKLVENLTFDGKRKNSAYSISEFVRFYQQEPEFMCGLLNQKTENLSGNLEPRFDADTMNYIYNNKYSNPDLMNMVNAKTYSEKHGEVYAYSGDDIKLLMSSKTPFQQKMLDINIGKNNEYKAFSGLDVQFLELQNHDYSELIDKLINNKKFIPFVKNLVKYSIPKDSKIIKLLKDDDKLEFMSQFVDENTLLAKVDNSYNDNIFNLQTFSSKGLKNVEFILDESTNNPKILSTETVDYKNNKSSVRREFMNGKVLVENLYYKTNENGQQIPQGYQKTFYKDDGVQEFSEVMTPIKNNPELFSVNLYKRGVNIGNTKTFQTQLKEYGKKLQGKKIIKEFHSPNGLVTKYVQINGPKGSSLSYVIKDKDGNSLLSQKRTYRKIDDNHYVSTLNDKKYLLNFFDNKVQVSKFDNQGNKLDEIEFDDKVLNFNLINLYKKLPGDYFFNIKDMNISKVGMIYMPGFRNQGMFNPNENSILMSPELVNNPFVFSHELGHAKDFVMLNKLHNDNTLKDIFNKEIDQYKLISSNEESKNVDYFIKKIADHPWHNISELIAETSALTSGLENNGYSDIYMRGVVLQQHFPESIAYIANKLNT